MSAQHNTSVYNLPLPENPEFYDVEDIRNISARTEEALNGLQTQLNDRAQEDLSVRELIDTFAHGKMEMEVISYQGDGSNSCTLIFSQMPTVILPICRVEADGTINNLFDIMTPVDMSIVPSQGTAPSLVPGGTASMSGNQYSWSAASPGSAGNVSGTKYYIAGLYNTKESTTAITVSLELYYTGTDGTKKALPNISCTINGQEFTANSSGVVTGISTYVGQSLTVELKGVFPFFAGKTFIVTPMRAGVMSYSLEVHDLSSESGQFIIYTESTTAFQTANGGYLPSEFSSGTYKVDIIPVGGGGGGGGNHYGLTYSDAGAGGGGGYFPDKDDNNYKNKTVTSVGAIVIGAGGKGRAGNSGTDGEATSIVLNSNTYSQNGGKGGGRNASSTVRYSTGGNGGGGGGAGGSFNISSQSTYYIGSRGAAAGSTAPTAYGGSGNGNHPAEIILPDGTHTALYGGGGGGGYSDPSSRNFLQGGSRGGSGGRCGDPATAKGGNAPAGFGGGGGGAGATTYNTNSWGGNGGSGMLVIKVHE